jgi:branched-chain amino acid transport system substrate-binding protein
MFSSPADAADKLIIGLVNDFSDYNSPCGDPMGKNFLRSVTMAYNDFVLDHPEYKDAIELRKFDYGSSVTDTERITRKLVTSDVLALVGYPCSSFAVLAAPIVDEAKIPLIMPSATMDELTQGKRYIFRSCFRDADQAKAMASFLYTDLHKRKSAIIVSADHPYSVNLANKFQEYFERNGGEVVKIYKILSTQKSFDRVISDLKTLNCDAVFIPNHEIESSAILKEISRQQVQITAAGGDGWGNLYGYIMSKLMGSNRIDAYAVSHWDVSASSSSSKSFIKRYEELFGESPNDNAALAYDAMSLLLKAVSRGHAKTRNEIAMSIRSIRHYNGVTGMMSFDQNEGTPRKNVNIVKYVGAGDGKGVGAERPFKVQKIIY